MELLCSVATVVVSLEGDAFSDIVCSGELVFVGVSPEDPRTATTKTATIAIIIHFFLLFFYSGA